MRSVSVSNACDQSTEARKRLLAAHRGARAAGQQPEPVVQAVDDLGQRQCPHPRRGQFDRQRHAVEALADLGHGGGVVVGDGEVGPEPGGRGRRTTRWPRRPATATAPARSLRPAHRSAHGWSPAPSDPGRRRAARTTSAARRVEQVLAVVQHQQHLPVADEPQQRVHRRAARLVGQAERAGGRDRHHVGIGDRRQIDVPDAVAEFGGDLGRDLHRQPGLARPAGTGQGDQPVVGQESRAARRSALARPTKLVS